MAKYLCKEYTLRYNKIHSVEKHIDWLSLQSDGLNIESRGIRKIKLAMPDIYKCSSSVKSYRNYYIGDKKEFAKWTKRPTPKWFI
tara:strand:- start:1135 stop:1389 length:255 start_codon:yes stop_codon:yes gene_type:complete